MPDAPSSIWLSENFLLSDFMGCDSIYRHGYANVFEGDERHLAHARRLAELLEYLLLSFGHFSISYGYISPSLSRSIVKYQNPDKPSYHRWDAGAAADVCFHNSLETSPLYRAWMIDRGCKYDRMITYAESPFICIGVNADLEEDKQRCKFYENRYVPGEKPLFIRKKAGLKRIEDSYDDCRSGIYSGTGWKGQGWPSHHGHGLRQVQHVRVGRHSVLSDFLYSDQQVHHGTAILEDLWAGKNCYMNLTPFQEAAFWYDWVYELVRSKGRETDEIFRLPIIEGYKPEEAPWKQGGFSFVARIPEWISCPGYEVEREGSTYNVRVWIRGHNIYVWGECRKNVRRFFL